MDLVAVLLSVLPCPLVLCCLSFCKLISSFLLSFLDDFFPSFCDVSFIFYQLFFSNIYCCTHLAFDNRKQPREMGEWQTKKKTNSSVPPAFSVFSLPGPLRKRGGRTHKTVVAANENERRIFFKVSGEITRWTVDLGGQRKETVYF